MMKKAPSQCIYDDCTLSEPDDAIFGSEALFDVKNDVSTADGVENMNLSMVIRHELCVFLLKKDT